MVNRGLRPLFENPRLSRCAHSHSSVRRANINFFTRIFFYLRKGLRPRGGTERSQTVTLLRGLLTDFRCTQR